MPNIPDYSRSIVNLVASIDAGLGARGDYVPLAELPAVRLAERPVVLMVIDGLGDALLARYPDSTLARHRAGRLTSVFPTTTASAITSFSTGVAPQQHAITGWFTWLRELGTVATVLPFVPRSGGVPFSALGIGPAQIVGRPPMTDRLRVPATVLSPAAIVNSDYSRAAAGRAERVGHTGLKDFFARLAKRLRNGEPQYVFAYWTEVDHLAHTHGIASAEVDAHFRELDAAFAGFLERIAGSGALVLATADHGLIDTAPDRVVRLEEYPALATRLALPLCGEPRAAFCYVRSGQGRAFTDAVAGELGAAAEVLLSAEALARGLFGLGTPEPRLADRIGDYVLLMRDNWVVRDRLLTEKPFIQIGVHGGLSADELYVPLIVAEC